MANLPTKDDIFNLLTLSYNVHDSTFHSDIFIKSFKKHFPIEYGDYVECNREIVSVGLIDIPTNVVVSYKRFDIKRKYVFSMESIKRCDISYVEEDDNDGWFNIGDGLRLNEDDCRGMIEKYGDE